MRRGSPEDESLPGPIRASLSGGALSVRLGNMPHVLMEILQNFKMDLEVVGSEDSDPMWEVLIRLPSNSLPAGLWALNDSVCDFFAGCCIME